MRKRMHYPSPDSRNGCKSVMIEWFALFRASLLRPEKLVIWIAATGVLVLAGPFGLHGKADPLRATLFWGLVLGLSILLASGLRAFVNMRFPPDAEMASVAFMSGAMTVILTPLILAADLVIFSARAEIVLVAVTVALVSAVIGSVRTLVHRADPPPPAPDGGDTPPVRLAARLTHDNARILAVSANDHYVIVQTNHGPEPVLLRFSDALAELEGLDGLRIHRSHWVAADAITAVRSTPQKMHVTLTDGTELPVSRSYRAAVEAAGFPSRTP